MPNIISNEVKFKINLASKRSAKELAFCTAPAIMTLNERYIYIV